MRFSSWRLPLAAVLIVGGGVWLWAANQSQWPEFEFPDWGKSEPASVGTFASAAEFQDYLQRGVASGESLGRATNASQAVSESDGSIAAPTQALDSVGNTGTAERVSGTNIQVDGVDEPDILKTDGERIYYSSTEYSWWGGRMPMIEDRMELLIEESQPAAISTPLSAPLSDQDKASVVTDTYNPSVPQPQTRIIDAFPPEQLALGQALNVQGDMLLSGSTLIIFSEPAYYGGDNRQVIYGYDVSDPDQPEEAWQHELSDHTTVQSARLYDGQLYVVLQTGVDQSRPCPVEPFLSGSSIPCDTIYRPDDPIAVDVTFSLMRIDPSTGDTEATNAFVGSADTGESVVYMGPEGLYVTYGFHADVVEYLSDFFRAESDLVSQAVVDRLEVLSTYDLSETAKMVEVQIVLERFQNSLSEEELRRFENEMSNRMADYATAHAREFQKTGIVRFSLPDLELAATGEVPGTPLNQFSLDYFDKHLRIATTIGDNLFGAAESVSDVYVLDDDLDEVGSVRDLGKTERIYSVRFVEDRGYVVTFRQTDPFYVIDLADPDNPELAGELKIPGYSSYLHPIRTNLILGAGMENGKVKLSLFDVADAHNPTEADKYLLDEYWSELLNTHHAFLLDAAHEVFFLPGGQDGYVFSYADDRLAIEKVITGIQAKRAVYMDEYLYVLGTDRLVVLDERNWREVNSLTFN